MTEHDPFERELRIGLAAPRAPESLHRRIAQIPLEHLRPGRSAGAARGILGTWFGRAGASWATSFAAAAASLALGIWLGFAGLPAGDNNSDELVALVFSDTPTIIGDEQ